MCNRPRPLSDQAKLASLASGLQAPRTSAQAHPRLPFCPTCLESGPRTPFTPQLLVLRRDVACVLSADLQHVPAPRMTGKGQSRGGLVAGRKAPWAGPGHLLTVPRGFCVGSSKQERMLQGGPCFSWAVSVAGCACHFPLGLEFRVSQQKAQTWTCSPCATWEYTKEEVPPGWGCPTRLGQNHRQAGMPVLVCAPNWSAPWPVESGRGPISQGEGNGKKWKRRLESSYQIDYFSGSHQVCQHQAQG